MRPQLIQQPLAFFHRQADYVSIEPATKIQRLFTRSRMHAKIG